MQITSAQNALIQVYSRQLCQSSRILVNGEATYLDHNDFRRYAAACFRKDAKRIALSPEGDAVILLPASTRTMSKDEAGEFIIWLQWYAAEIAKIKLVDRFEPEGKP